MARIDTDPRHVVACCRFLGREDKIVTMELEGPVRINSLDAGGRALWPPAMPEPSPFSYFWTSPAVIRREVTLYVRFPLSFQNVEDPLHKRATFTGWGAERHATLI